MRRQVERRDLAGARPGGDDAVLEADGIVIQFLVADLL